MNPPFLNGRRSSVRLRVPSGKIRKEFPARIDAAPASNRSQRRLLVAAIDGDETAVAERARQDRNRVDFGFVEDVQAGMDREEQHGRVDVALMVRAVDRRTVARHVLEPGDAEADAAQHEPEPDADVAEHVEMTLRAEHRGNDHPRRRDDQDVEGDGDVGEDGAESRDHRRRR